MSEEDVLIDNLLLHEMVGRLTPKQQVVVALRTAGYTQEDAGKILGMTRAAVGFIFTRAINVLRARYDQEDAGG